ncbi:MAG TPA: 2-oxo acid dehydrogenase subunit E2 [Blastocatellia bacterium]|jgi:pyruvate dehydrogenase E2 component (dihydrolipoamide acetyltransferase)|nr:2-oxo acid dehydrogenase subunit E2 [Blastocatellia bacterium]
MATEIKLPILGENVDSGSVVNVLVSEGDEVAEGQPVIELETEKATVEVPASASGRVKEVSVKEGETIKVGQVILILEEGAAAKAEERKPRPAAKSAEELRETAEAREEKAKAVAAPSQAPRAETQARPHIKEAKPSAEEAKKESPPPRDEKAEKEEAQQREVIKPRPEARPKPEQAPRTEEARELIAAAPSVRRLARELGIDINEVVGSEPGGRVSEEDVRNYARSIILNVTRLRPAAVGAARPLLDFSKWGEIERKPMSGIRRKTSAALSEAWQTIPHVTHFDQADITELEELRERFGKKAEATGGKLTITAIALKVAASALKVFPQFNASVDVSAEEIIYKKYCNIGVAVDTDRGLLVPVIRDADKKNILELAVELAELSEKARNRKIAIEEMQGGSFTITNLGGIGGVNFSPIINSPEVAILGVARAARQPVFVDGQIAPRLMLPLALSYDHRLIDGADAARFLRWVAEALEQPLLLALEG